MEKLNLAQIRQRTKPGGAFTLRKIWLQAFAVWTNVPHPISTVLAEDMSFLGSYLPLELFTVAATLQLSAYHSQIIKKKLQPGTDVVGDEQIYGGVWERERQEKADLNR